MPSKNIRKIYVADGIYHIYNRGIDKRDIFMDDQDRYVFLKYFRQALSPSRLDCYDPDGIEDMPQITKRPVKNFHTEIDLVAYCLMPNHFHLLIRQHEQDAMKRFVQSIIIRYTGYFNKRHSRTGTLWQGAYKACLINEEPYFLHVARYIHRNPISLGESLSYRFSSYQYHLNQKPPVWLNNELIEDQFRGPRIPMLRYDGTYKSFVENEEIDSSKLLGQLTLE